MKPHREYVTLWSLLAVAFVGFFCYSFSDPVTIDSVELRPSDMSRRIMQRHTPHQGAQSVVNALRTVNLFERPAPLNPVDTTAQSILLIGDSMLEGINPRLAAYAKANGHKLNSVIWYSSTTAYWGACDTLSSFIRKYHPTYIIISLGANELFVPDIASKRERFVKHMIAEIGSIPYLWIGPPNWKKDTGINELIRRNVPKGCYFKSDGMKFDRTSDGAHPTHSSAALWVDSVFRWMPANAQYPIRMEAPATGVKGRPSTVTILKPLTGR